MEKIRLVALLGIILLSVVQNTSQSGVEIAHFKPAAQEAHENKAPEEVANHESEDYGPPRKFAACMTPEVTEPDTSAESTKLISVKLPIFEKSFKTPCWYECLTSLNPYHHNPYFTEEFGKSNKDFQNIRQMLHRTRDTIISPRLRNGQSWVLKCLPYAYVFGAPFSKPYDFFDIISRHPEVLASSGKNSHWWEAKRYEQNTFWMENEVESFRYYIQTHDHSAEMIRKSMIKDNSRGGIYHPKVLMDIANDLMWNNYHWNQTKENLDAGNEPRIVTAHYMAHVQPTARFIGILKNPVERAYYEFASLHKNEGGLAAKFNAAVSSSIEALTACFSIRSLRSCLYDKTVANREPSLNKGIYYVYLRDWFQRYPREQFRLILQEDFQTKPDEVLVDIYQFLNVAEPDTETLSQLSEMLRETTYVAAGAMFKSTRKMLEEFYHPFNVALSQLLKDKAYLWQKK